MTNKEIWQLWVKEYNSLIVNNCCGTTYEKDIEEKFYKPYPKKYRSLIDALISCVKWHKLNRSNYLSGSDLCGHCYNASNKKPHLICPECKKDCKLYKKLNETCYSQDSLFAKSHRELTKLNETSDPCPSADKMYKVLLSIYQEEYEKLFGKDWQKE